MSVLFYYKKSLIKALLHLFPDIGLDSAKFTAKQKSFWQDIDNQRKFCVQFAESRSLNPLIAENWYSIPADEFLAEEIIGPTSKTEKRSLSDLHTSRNLTLWNQRIGTSFCTNPRVF
eukprot:Phypoly_transcript_18470.p1 GENE.Phypoly_transcript_18470~~Phypoly_transcript_18470.p1  ORF type:complete len:117 (-),score=15.28 Phypoly_transcript_18470:184-534(-)